MDLKFFRFFITANYNTNSTEEIETLTNLGAEFKEFLIKKYHNVANGNDILNKIWDISPSIIMYNVINIPSLTYNGYNPKLVIHFSEFIQKTHNEIKLTYKQD